MHSDSNTNKLIRTFFPETLIDTGSRDLPKDADEQAIQLDKNELPYEISSGAKEQIIDKLKNTNWNRYPSPYYPGIESQLANYAGVEKSNIVLGIGAAQLITMLFNLLARKNLIITYPSFSLFEYLCRTYGINFQRWKLDENFEYNAGNLPPLRKETVIILASPNNPTGTLIRKTLLESLLKENPETFFIVDEVYSEFSNCTNKELLKSHSNLILIRSFSKAFGLAGVRAGYLLCSTQIAKQLRKLVLPFVLNHYSEITLKTILTSKTITFDILDKINKVSSERDRIYKELKNLETTTDFQVFPSHSNFLLLKFLDETKFSRYLSRLEEQHIRVMNLSHLEELKNSIRLTIGKPEENDKALKCLKGC